VLVVDASVLATALADDGADGDTARGCLLMQDLAAPELIDLEVTSVLRRQLTLAKHDLRRAQLALTDLFDLPMFRAPHRPLLGRCWELRGNLSVYDAAYVALAEALGTVLLTADGRLAKAPGIKCVVEVVKSGSRRR
jgi:predicted nucleic acid-binding protein